ncbi:MAG TPA: SET domain-containing protein [Flavisolibacter sp.]|jgi:hypothetical protein|nr:SET domain-containing protein [Flavisolibacter sp.]
MKVSLNIVEIRESRFGRGLFAQRNLEEGTTICPISGPSLSFEETVRLKERESHTLQIGIDQYIYCNLPFLFTNHSCNPNCGITPSMDLIAIRNIKEDEELFWDYSTSMLERHWTMPCACGEEQCRSLVTDFDLLPSTLQEKYLSLNIVLPFIVNTLFPAYAKTAS